MAGGPSFPGYAKILLDTHAFIWIATGDERLGPRLRNAYESGHDCVLSVASIWEMAIKASLGRLTLREPLSQLLHIARAKQGIEVLDIGPEHALKVQELPFHHRDPFDRLLIAQAQVERYVLATRDPEFEAYSVELMWWLSLLVQSSSVHIVGWKGFFHVEERHSVGSVITRELDPRQKCGDSAPAVTAEIA